jgi:putative endonuclease
LAELSNPAKLESCKTGFNLCPRPAESHGHVLFRVHPREQTKRDVVYGVTNNLARRIAEHKAKLVPGFARQYSVDMLVYFEACDSILEARAREHSLKRWRRAWKIELIEKLNPDWHDLAHQLNS